MLPTDGSYLGCKTNYTFVTHTNTSTHKIDIQKLLINEFPDVIHNALNPVPVKTDPIHSYLKETDERPLRISTAHPIPKHFQPAAERCIRDLLDKGVIEKVVFPCLFRSKSQQYRRSWAYQINSQHFFQIYRKQLAILKNFSHLKMRLYG